MVAKDGDWQASLQAGEQEWRRMAEFGFTNAEVEQARAALLSQYKTAAAQSNSTRSAAIASVLATSSLTDNIYQSAEDQLALFETIAPTLTAEAAKATG